MGPPGHSGSWASGRRGLGKGSVPGPHKVLGDLQVWPRSARRKPRGFGPACGTCLDLGRGGGVALDRPPEASRVAQVQHLAREGSRRERWLRDPVHFG